MTTKRQRFRELAPRDSIDVPLLKDPPLGYFQALVLKKLDELGRDAFGYNVLEQLSVETGVWLDHSQIYSTIRKLLINKTDNGDPEPYIVHIDTRASTTGGPPFKVYELTAAGRAALKATADHHKAVSDFLNNKRKATRT